MRAWEVETTARLLPAIRAFVPPGQVTRARVVVHLGFNVSAHVRFTLDGVPDESRVASRLEDARRCLITAIAGKPLLVLCKPFECFHTGGDPVARCYVNEVPKGEPPPDVLSTPPGADRPLIEVGGLMSFLDRHSMDVHTARSILRGHTKGGAVC